MLADIGVMPDSLTSQLSHPPLQCFLFNRFSQEGLGSCYSTGGSRQPCPEQPKLGMVEPSKSKLRESSSSAEVEQFWFGVSNPIIPYEKPLKQIVMTWGWVTKLGSPHSFHVNCKFRCIGCNPQDPHNFSAWKARIIDPPGRRMTWILYIVIIMSVNQS